MDTDEQKYCEGRGKSIILFPGRWCGFIYLHCTISCTCQYSYLASWCIYIAPHAEVQNQTLNQTQHQTQTRSAHGESRLHNISSSLSTDPSKAGLTTCLIRLNRSLEDLPAYTNELQGNERVHC